MKMKNKYKQIEELLSNKGLVNSLYPSMAEIMQKIKSGSKLKVLYGETYDKFGLTIDSLKYYFYISLLHKLLEQAGVTVNSVIIIGDIHSVKNEIVKNKESLLKHADARLETLKAIIKTYNLSFEPVLMSAAYKEKGFITRLERVRSVFKNSKRFKSMAEKTVLKNKLSQENKADFQYTIEEVALIMDYDIKVGPPREIHYDKIARLMGKKLKSGNLSGVYLKPTYPLGLGFDYFVSHPEIEKYGLTPYKAGSNRLQDYRIIIGKTPLKKIQNLIDNSFIPNDPQLPNPVVDLFIIAEMARMLLKEKLFIKLPEQICKDSRLLRDTTYHHLKKYIYKPLNL